MIKQLFCFIFVSLAIIANGSLLAQAEKAADKYEKDDTWKTAKEIKLEETQERTFTTSKDVDWLKLTITNTGYYLFDAIASFEPWLGVDCAIELYASDIVLLEENDNYLEAMNDARLYVLLAPGKYYLKVYTLSNNPDIYSNGQNGYSIKFSNPK